MAGRFEGFEEFVTDLDAFCSQDAIHKRLAEDHGGPILDVVIGAAEAGGGPGDAAYKPYSKSYAQRIAKAGGVKLWLRGISRSGRFGGMLDREQFVWEVDGEGRLWLVWEGGPMGVYAAVHQGTAYGGADDSRGNIPPRPWLHFESSGAQGAVMSAYEQTLDEMAADFTAGTIAK